MWIKTENGDLLKSENIFSIGVKCSIKGYKVVAYSGGGTHESLYVTLKTFDEESEISSLEGKVKCKKEAQEYLEKLASKLGAEEMTMEEDIRISSIKFEPEYGKYILRINGWHMGEFETKDEAEKALEKYRKIFGERGIIID